MKICERCGKRYDEQDTFATPMEELGQIFLRSVKGDEIDGLCQDCKKELGILNVMGFEE